jgi:hypothetical protein
VACRDEKIFVQVEQRRACIQAALRVGKQVIDRADQSHEPGVGPRALVDGLALRGGRHARRLHPQPVTFDARLLRAAVSGKLQCRDEIGGVGARLRPVIPCQPPAFGRGEAAGRVALQRCQHRIQWLCAVQGQIKHVRVAGQVAATGDARQLGAIGFQHHHRGISQHAECIGDALCTRRIPIKVYRHELAQRLLEITAREYMRLQVVAGRTPLGAPVEEDQLVLLRGGGEGGIDVALEPVDALDMGDAGGSSWRCAGLLRRCFLTALAAGQHRDKQHRHEY